MEMRKVNDLKTLNRLLLNPTTLDGTNAHDVSELIKNGKLIPLSVLAAKADRQGFNPPKALGLIRPGAENVIYNAPRYYHFGEDFLTKALMIAESPSNGYEVELLQHEMKDLAKYPNLVLYSSQGMQWAVQAQKALNAFLPNNKMLIAYLKFNSRGAVSSSH